MCFSGANFVIERGDRIALVGVNGAGKSTLIKLLAGAEPLTSGEYKLGHNVEPDYFAQDQYKELDPDARMLDDLYEVGAKSTQTELRNLLGCFLFSEDDVFKQIGVLSGGERNRYALARMLLHPTNFLLLDEPTNHLDMRAKDVLLEALQEFTRHGGVRFARPLFHRQAGDADFRSGRRRGAVFPGQLRRLSVAQSKASRWHWIWLRRAPANGHHAGRRRRLPPAPVQAHQSAEAAADAGALSGNRRGRSRAARTEIAGYEAALGNFVSTEETLRLTQADGAAAGRI